MEGGFRGTLQKSHPASGFTEANPKSRERKFMQRSDVFTIPVQEDGHAEGSDAGWRSTAERAGLPGPHQCEPRSLTTQTSAHATHSFPPHLCTWCHKVAVP